MKIEPIDFIIDENKPLEDQDTMRTEIKEKIKQGFQIIAVAATSSRVYYTMVRVSGTPGALMSSDQIARLAGKR